ncbi:MAG TPA: nitrile hydratase subunit beta [Caulobacteraceae bacterium]
MNGVHDMGGMDGLGAVAREQNEPVFHETWEGRVLALTLAVGAWGKWNIDTARHQRERISGEAYLAMSYYERWLAGLVALMVDQGLVTSAELATGRPELGAAASATPLIAARVADLLASGGPSTREYPAPRRFTPGNPVLARNINPRGHTRLPRYIRGRRGVIERDHGVHVFPDTHAHGGGECPQRLYGVRFSARELWGEAAALADTVHLDMWDSYLEPA